MLDILAFSAEGELVARWSRSGARYISCINVLPDNRISFVGQIERSITFADHELVIRPSIYKVDAPRFGPMLPRDQLRYDPLPANPAMYLMFELSCFRFWPVSYRSSSLVALAVIVTDLQNQIKRVINCAGARRTQHISLDDDQKRVRLTGSGGNVAFQRGFLDLGGVLQDPHHAR